MVKKKTPIPATKPLTIREKLRTPAYRMSWVVSGEMVNETKKKNEEFEKADRETKDWLDSL